MNMMYTNNIPLMRTIPEAFRMLKAEDENTAITLHAVRKLVKNKVIKSFQVDSKTLIDFNDLINCISGGCNIA